MVIINNKNIHKSHHMESRLQGNHAFLVSTKPKLFTSYYSILFIYTQQHWSIRYKGVPYIMDVIDSVNGPQVLTQLCSHINGSPKTSIPRNILNQEHTWSKYLQ